MKQKYQCLSCDHVQEGDPIRIDGRRCEKCDGAIVPVKPIPTKPDMVNHPPHYTQGGIETIDFMKAKLTPDGFRGYLCGNVIKYMTRYEHKNGLEDLKKAQWYLAKLIVEVESHGTENR